jgi:centromere/kinetochore protein ZW10
VAGVLNQLRASRRVVDGAERQKQKVDTILVDGAQGFLDSADQARYDECEAALIQVLNEIRHLASKLKVNL